MSELEGFFVGTEMPNTGWWGALWPDPTSVLERAGLKAGASAVDLCCGDGWFTLPMARLASRVTAIDIDPALLEVARQRLVNAGVSNVAFRAGDAFNIAALAAPADFVFLANAFHGVPDRARLARAVRDTLKDGGLFAIVNWHKRPREETVVLGEPRGPKTELRMSPQETREAVEAGGLVFERFVEVPPYHYGAVFRRGAAPS
jgi:SAM-dependent methyltransferase